MVAQSFPGIHFSLRVGRLVFATLLAAFILAGIAPPSEAAYSAIQVGKPAASLQPVADPLRQPLSAPSSALGPTPRGSMDEIALNIGHAGSPLQPSSLPPNSFAVTDSLSLDQGETSFYAGVIDTAGGYAYFGVSSVPGKVVKIRLSDLSRVGALTLSGTKYVSSAVLDPVRGYAYFGTDEYPGKIVQVRLSDFAQTGTLTLNSGENTPSTALIDPQNGFAYFGTDTFPTKLVKIRLADFTEAATLTLSIHASGDAAVIDTGNGFAYFGCDCRPGKIVKVRLSDFTEVATLTLNTGEEYLRTAIIDPDKGFAYFAGSYYSTSSKPIVKIDLSTFTRTGALKLSTDVSYDQVSGAMIDPQNSYAYFWTGYGMLFKMRLSNFTLAASRNLGQQYLNAGVIDVSRNSAYFAQSVDPGRVMRLQLSDLSIAGSITLEPAQRGLKAAAIDTAHGLAYYGTYRGQVVRVQLGNFTVKDVLQVDSEYDSISVALMDTEGGYAYFATSSTPTKLFRVRLSDFSLAGMLALNADEGGVTSGVIDIPGGHAYLGTGTNPGRIVKVRLSDLTRVGALTLNTDEGPLTAAILDKVNGFAYFGERNRLIKVRLSDFNQQNGMTLYPDEYVVRAAPEVVDGYAYLGVNCCTSTTEGRVRVIKIRVADLVRVQEVLFDGIGMNLGAIDSTNGYAYFGFYDRDQRIYPPPHLLKVRLSDLQSAVIHVGLNGENGAGFDSALIDPAGYGLVAGSTYQGGLVLRLDLGNTRTTLTSSANSLRQGDPVTFTASTTAMVANTDAPGGTIQFQVDGVNRGSPVTLAGGVASSGAISDLKSGTHQITALYVSPDGSWNDSRGSLTQTVGQATTTIALASAPHPSAEGQAITVTFTVTPESATGTVTVSDGSATCSASVAAGSCTLILINPGSKTLTATYAGDADHADSTGTLSHTVTNLVPVLTSLSHPSSMAGGPAFTLTVTGDQFIPGTTIQWNGSARTTTFVSTTQLTATIPASDLALPGTISITVKHPGSQGDSSTALTHTVTGTAQDVPLYLPLIMR